MPNFEHDKVCPTYKTDWYLWKCHKALETASPEMRKVILIGIAKLEAGVLMSDDDGRVQS